MHSCKGSIHAPGANFTFAGDNRICTNTTEAEQLIFGLDQDANVNWWDFWIKTGFVASLFVQVLITNLGLSVHGLADPLSQCAGQFEFPSNRLVHVSIVDHQALQSRFEKGLWTVSAKWCAIWFLLVKLCLFNLMMASSKMIQGSINEDDTIATIQVVFWIILVGALVGVFLLALTVLARRQRLSMEQPQRISLYRRLFASRKRKTENNKKPARIAI